MFKLTDKKIFTILHSKICLPRRMIFFSDLLEETCIHPPSDDSDVTNSPQVSFIEDLT